MSAVGEPRHGLGGEARHHAAYLAHYRSALVEGVRSVPVERRRTSLLPSGWSPLELLSHVVHMEQRWFVWGFLGEPVADPWGDWNVEEPWESPTPGARWVVAQDVTLEDLVRRLEDVARRTEEVLAGHDLAEKAAPGGRFAEDPPDLRWICFHVLQEYARHAGHLDIVVELESGRA